MTKSKKRKCFVDSKLAILDHLKGGVKLANEYIYVLGFDCMLAKSRDL